MSMTLTCDICGKEMNERIGNTRSKIVEIKSIDDSIFTFNVTATVSAEFNTTDRHWCNNCLDGIVKQAFL